ncbi:WGR domain-containing protein [Aureimonas sp. AU4]|uniref:WGR domain-containing protein n=1 Tax=Aureimonas sp. AU4 TaxID=1638163 RepID=UPI0012E362E1
MPDAARFFLNAAHLQSMDPARNRARFYTMDVVRDLFGAWVLVKLRGRIGMSGCSST